MSLSLLELHVEQCLDKASSQVSSSTPVISREPAIQAPPDTQHKTPQQHHSSSPASQPDAELLLLDGETQQQELPSAAQEGQEGEPSSRQPSTQELPSTQTEKRNAFAKMMQQQRLLSSSDSFVLSHSEQTGWHWWWFSSATTGHSSAIQGVLRQHAQAQPPPTAVPVQPAVLSPPTEGFVKSSQLLQPSPVAPPPAAEQARVAEGDLHRAAGAAAEPAVDEPQRIAWSATVAGALNCAAFLSPAQLFVLSCIVQGMHCCTTSGTQPQTLSAYPSFQEPGFDPLLILCSTHGDEHHAWLRDPPAASDCFGDS